MTQVIEFIGCKITDEVYETDERIAGHSLMWNVSRLQRDAEAGKFGTSIIRPMSILPPMTAAHTANIDWMKVQRYKERRDILDRPVICLDCYDHRHIINGNHRLAARRMAGLEFFETFIVPESVERAYRVTIIADGREITWSDLE